MPNVLGSRQWRLDTPIAFGQPNAVIWSANIDVEQIEWSGFAASGNLIIKDQTGRIVWDALISGTDTILAPVRLSKVGWVNGMVLDTLTGGIITVYIK
jgi:hypothetical protein